MKRPLSFRLGWLVECMLLVGGLVGCAWIEGLKPDTTGAPENSLEVPHLGWVWPAEGTRKLMGHVIANDGTIYVSDWGNSRLQAVESPGTVRWTYEVEGKPQISEPLLAPDEKTIYFLTDENQLYAVGSDGKQRWVFEPDRKRENFSSLPVIGPDGSLYVQTYDQGESIGYRISPDGKAVDFPWPEWTDPEGYGFDSQGNLYGFSWRGLTILSPEGKELARCEVEERSSELSTGPENTVLYALEDGSVIAQKSDCEPLWSIQLGEAGKRGEAVPFVAIWDAAQTVYVGGPKGQLFALNATDGTLRWQSEPDADFGDTAEIRVAGPGRIWMLGAQGRLAVFNSTQGKRIWTGSLYGSGLPRTIRTTSTGDLVMVYKEQLMAYTENPAWHHPEPTPVPLPEDRAQAEKEIVASMLDFLVKSEIGEMADYILTSGQPWVDAPPDASIIIYAPTATETPESSFNSLDSDHPIQVWWYAENQLIEADDKRKAIEEYTRLYIDNEERRSRSNIFVWGYYEFGILSISDDYQQAVVYVGAMCGPLCGHGFRYTLQRSPSGEWWIVSGEHLWQS